MRAAEEAGRATSARALEDLQHRVGPVIAQTVDALQVAALLEADGITDPIARDQYGFDDVFALATEVRRRTMPGVRLAGLRKARGAHSGPSDLLAGLHRALRTPRSWFALAPRQRHRARRDGHAVRLVSHGLLYLLPALMFPPVLSLLSRDALVLGLVVGGAVAWVWAGAATWLGYRLLGGGDPESAGRMLRLFALSGLPVALLGGVAVVAIHGGGPGLVLVALGQMAYQMGATLLMFYRRETTLVLVMVPGVIAGVGYLLVPGGPVTLVAVLVAAACAAGVFFAAVNQGDIGGSEHLQLTWSVLQGARSQFLLVVAYTILSAGYLLHAQSRYMFGSLQVAVGLLPLIVAMGVVEWRAYRFPERSHALMARVRYPAEFAVGVRRLVATDLGACFAAVASIGSVLLVALAIGGLLTSAGVAMTLASMFLAGAYYVSFLLTGMAKLLPLCVATGVCLTLHVLVDTLSVVRLHPLLDTSVFAGSALLLLLLSLAALLPSVTEPRAYA